MLKNVREGMTTLKLDKIAENSIIEQRVKPVFKLYIIKDNKF